MSNYNINTICVQGGYEPKNGEARVVPIVQSTTFKYESSEKKIDKFRYTIRNNFKILKNIIIFI